VDERWTQGGEHSHAVCKVTYTFKLKKMYMYREKQIKLIGLNVSNPCAVNALSL
jgi:hypothetical protein